MVNTYFDLSEADKEKKHLVVPEGVKVVGRKNFYSWSRECKWETVTLPSTLVKIEMDSFNYYRSIKSINIPSSVREIGDYAFHNCEGLEKLSLPASCVVLGKDVFPTSRYGWQSSEARFKEIEVDPQNEVYSSVDGILFSKDKETLILCPFKYDAEEYVVPDGVKEIMPGAFNGCVKIKKIVVAESVKKIGQEAFSDMKSLEEIVLPKDFPVLRSKLFEDSHKLERVSFPDNLREIGSKCFSGTNIKSLKIPLCVKKIGISAFANIYGLEDVILPPDFPVLKSKMFEKCGRLQHITWPKNLREIGSGCFANTGLDSLELPENIEFIGKKAFMAIKAKRLRLPKSLKCFAVSAFDGMQELEVYDTSDIDTYQDNLRLSSTITVLSAEDDSVKLKIRIPDGQTASVKSAFSHAWGKNADFDFDSVDRVFRYMSDEAKFNYMFDRLHSNAEIPDRMASALIRYVSSRKEVAEYIFKNDFVEELALLEPFGFVKKNTIEARIDEAGQANAIQCKIWLLNWQNKNSAAKKKKEKDDLGLTLRI